MILSLLRKFCPQSSQKKIDPRTESSLKILMVDDQRTNLLANKAILQDALSDIICDLAQDGREALEMFNAKNYDIIITDLEMPVMDGLSFAREVRKTNIDIPIISYTSVLKEKVREESKKAGINEFLEKPISHSHLLNTICKLTSRPYNKEIETHKKPESSNTINSLPILSNRLDKDILNEVKDIFISDAIRLQELIIKAAQEQNIKEFYFHTHALKGVAGNMGAEKLFAYVTNINDCSKQGKFPEQKDWVLSFNQLVEEVIEVCRKI
ncbi:MAG: hypothetical protein K0R25_431 [Rickettsiaceae bacterium]|jgi:CheY-like chemotaxis protein|nr:hypothetical protein [Rickettsiaceae bacterium]